MNVNFNDVNEYIQLFEKQNIQNGTYYITSLSNKSCVSVPNENWLFFFSKQSFDLFVIDDRTISLKSNFNDCFIVPNLKNKNELIAKYCQINAQWKFIIENQTINLHKNQLQTRNIWVLTWTITINWKPTKLASFDKMKNFILSTTLEMERYHWNQLPLKSMLQQIYILINTYLLMQTEFYYGKKLILVQSSANGFHLLSPANEKYVIDTVSKGSKLKASIEEIADSSEMFKFHELNKLKNGCYFIKSCSNEKNCFCWKRMWRATRIFQRQLSKYKWSFLKNIPEIAE